MKRNLIYLLLLLLPVFMPVVTEAQQCNGNYLSASGNKLYDSNGNEVRLTGVNWFGFETSMLYPHGIWSRDCKSMLQQIKDQGFNCIRIPWCNKILDASATININSYGVDPYTGVSPMNALESTKTKPIEIMDIIVEWCQENNMKIILDNHSREPDGYMNELLWYTNATPESQWISDWVFLADRYKNFDAVVAMDLNNEPHGKYGNGATWGNSNPATDWNKAAERCGNAILEVNPNVLIMVEGIEEYQNETYWWGGNLKGVQDYPVQLSNPSKLVYSPHEYGPTVFNQSWFSAPDFPQNMSAIWEEHFNFIHTQGISPLFVGEFGIRDPDGTDEVWFDTFMAFMGQKGYSWTFWCWNPNSGDTGGLLDDQWQNIVTWKMAKLTPYLAPEIPNCGGNTEPNTPPVADVAADPLTGQPGVNVTFDASGSADPDGVIISYSWNFGDGTTGSGETILHNYSSAGMYVATLTVTDNEGGTDQASVTITVDDGSSENQAPDAAIAAVPVTGSAPLAVSFSAAGSSDPDGDPLNFSWNFGDGSTATGVNPGHTYLIPGTYTASVTISDGELSDQADITITVSEDIPGNEPPVAVASASPVSGEAPLIVIFDGSASYDPDGDALTYSWNFGDGTSGSGISVSHTYSAAAIYSAVLTVNDGALDSQANLSIEVTEGSTPSDCEDPVPVDIPFAQDGAGDYCFVTTTEIAFINNWNMDLVEINGVDYTNTWSNNLPPAVNGEWVIRYVGAFPWSHFEAPQAKLAEDQDRAQDISVYPNPFSEEFTIDLGALQDVSRIELMSPLGQLVYFKEMNEDHLIKMHISLSEPAGIYLLRIHTGNTVIVRPVVKNN